MAEQDAKQATTEKTPRTPGQRATINLRAARKSYQANDWTEDRKSQYLVDEARVLALLELAEALRNGATKL